MRATDSVALSEETIDQALARLARDCGQDPALRWLDETGPHTMSWAEVHSRACAAAATFLELNPRRARTAIVAPNSVDWIVAMFGCAIARMTVVPISPSSADAEVAHMLSLSRAGLVLASKRFGDREVLQRIGRVAETISVRPVVHDIADYDAASWKSTSYVGGRTGADEFLVQFTSGTTGLPKAAVLSHQAVLNTARLFVDAVGLQPGDIFLNPLPLHHVGGSVTGLLLASAVAGTYVIIERFDSVSALRAIREFAPAAIGSVPTMLADILALPDVSPSDFASVRIVMTGATAVDSGLIEEMERRLNVKFVVSYGQSEAPGMVTSAPSDPIELRLRTLGHCVPGRDYYICDPNGSLLATGMVGELCVRGPLTMSGYLRDDGALEPATDDAGWMHTGDLCSMDDHGIVTFRGRIRDVIIRGGENVYPAEVEHVITAHPSVAEAAVFGVPDTRLGERVVAVVLPAAGATVDVDDLSTFVAKRLSRYKRPVEWMIAATLPRTSTGKVLKHQLQQWYEAGSITNYCRGRDSL
ncbi:AMP-dependent synthetase [Mycobacterium sp. E342]|uniref:Long-chain-fatty-acid--CoA ligase FadD13 n=1 Tax=Mycobacterium paraseoulense TaxID=590652 RepID=A0A1X0IFT5_9MYCO|nr:AMP-dependent synthetase [Mycobacterium sp. E3247]OBH37736.1 AMP-dependent synthetase [Mycobacterium sp. E342]ORB45583.1 AMP-dependent synthetase [Mycobacterium paraseoulense]